MHRCNVFDTIIFKGKGLKYMNNKVSDILEKINLKIDDLSVKKETAKELKAEIDNLAEIYEESDLNEKLELINSKLDALESHNMSLKDSVYDFVTSTTKTLETLTKTDSSNDVDTAEKLNEFLKTIDSKIGKIIEKKTENGEVAIFSDDENQFKKLKTELTFFQNEIEERINENFSGIGETVTTVISEIKNKMTELEEVFEQNSEKLLTDIISDVKQLKSDISDLSDSVGSIDKQAIFNTEKNVEKVIELTEKSKSEIVEEVQELKAITAKSAVLDAKSKEAIETFKSELNLLKANIHTQIREVLSKIVVQDEIKFLCEEAITGIKNNGSETGVVRKYLKDLKAGDDRNTDIINEIKNILVELSEYELNDNADKVDIIYENLSMLNNWASTSDKIIENFDGVNEHFNTLGTSIDEMRDDFDVNSDKIDIIYENLTFINEWVQKLDKFAKDIDVLKSGYESESRVSNKLDEIYANINLIKEWNKKADALALQVRALSVQISETESTVNSQNLADMKKMFAQLTDDMSNLSSRTNKMILETDKTNDTMRGHLFNLQNIITSLEKQANNFGIEELKEKIEDIKKNSTKSTDFEKCLTESFIYLAEWIDMAGNSINSIKQELSDLTTKQEEQFSQIQQLSENKDEEDETAEQVQNFIQNIQEQSLQQIQTLNEQNNLAVQKIIENQNLQIQQLKEQNDFAIQQLAAQQALNQQLLQDIKANTREKPAEPVSQPDNSEIIENLHAIANLIEENKTDNQTKINELLQDTTEFVQNKTDNSEIKNLLDFIAAQVVNINENNSKTDILAKRLDTIENKLSTLEQYMAKLVDYLDED